MANEQEDLDLDVKKGGGKGNLVLYLIIAVLLLVIAGGAGWYFLMPGQSGDAQGEAEEVALSEKALYLPLETLVVNFSQKGPARYLQVDLQAMTHNPEALEALETHMPVIRNDILLLLAGQSYEQASTREGKQALQAEILATINKVVSQHVEGPAIEAVYFTNFVMQ